MAKYFYVKNGLGTRTTGGGLTKQTGSFTTLGAANVYNTFALALADTLPPVVGDFVIMSNAHLFNGIAATTYTLPSGLGIFIVSVSDTACDTFSAGATEQTTGSFALTITGNGSFKGVTLIAGITGAGTLLALSNASLNVQTYELCSLQTAGSGSSNISLSAATGHTLVTLKNTTIKFASTTAQFTGSSTDFKWEGGGFVAGSAATTVGLFTTSSQARVPTYTLTGVDMTNMGAATPLLDCDFRAPSS